MMNQETLVQIGRDFEKQRSQIRASILTSIFLLIQADIDAQMTSDHEGSPGPLYDELSDFAKFYEQMLIGVTPETEEEEGYKPFTVDDLLEKINGMSLSPHLNRLCRALANHLRPLEPLEY